MVYAASHQFKYNSSIFICKFDYPETRRREEESIKPSRESCISSPKKVGSRKIIFQTKKQLTRQERNKERTVEEAKKEQDFKKKSIVNSTRGSWQDKEEEENVLSTRGQDKYGKDLR